MKRIVKLFAIVSMMIGITACGNKIVVDYGDAESFEAALNAGENLEGKTVQFVADELHPDSASGYNVWAGEHLNFISSRNPDIKAGDIVTVKATEIESALGSWLIKYEKIENGQIGETTITNNSEEKDNEGDQSSVNESQDMEDDTKNIVYKAEHIPEDDNTDEEIKDNELSTEAVDAGIVAFKGYFGDPMVSAYVAFKNVSDVPIILRDARIEYQDDDGKLLSVDNVINCIPEAIKPGQIGYMYSYHHSLEGVDVSNGLNFIPDAQVCEASNYYEIDISDASFKTGTGLGVEVTARGSNNTGKDRSLAEPGSIFFDKDGKVMGFCYGIESFTEGQTKAFSISGSLLSEDYKDSDVDHVEIYLQGNDWY